MRRPSETARLRISRERKNTARPSHWLEPRRTLPPAEYLKIATAEVIADAAVVVADAAMAGVTHEEIRVAIRVAMLATVVAMLATVVQNPDPRGLRRRLPPPQ